jgi:hypothetical protein
MPVLLVAAAGISNTEIRQDSPELRFAFKNDAVQAHVSPVTNIVPARCRWTKLMRLWEDVKAGEILWQQLLRFHAADDSTDKRILYRYSESRPESA